MKTNLTYHYEGDYLIPNLFRYTDRGARGRIPLFHILVQVRIDVQPICKENCVSKAGIAKFA